jgi:hypothetical protein
MNDLDRDDWFSVYINSITRGMIHIQIILHLKKRTFDVSISGKLEGIARLQRKMTLPKYLNLFQEVRLGAENSLKRET